MTSAISELTQSLSGIASEAGKLATQTQEFADDVENTQNAIRDLLDRVSPSGLWDGIQAVFSGDALEELKEIADDIKSVLEGYGHQAEGRRDILQIAMGMIDDAIVSVEKWARREFPQYLGEDVGSALATYLDFELTLGQGILAGGVDLVEGIGQFDPLRFAYDPEGAKDAWVGMAESLGESMFYATPTGILGNPGGAFNHWKNQVTDAVHAEDWSSDRPGYGLGKIVFDVGAALVPGGPALRTTKVAAEAVDVATPSPGRIPGGPGGPGGLIDDLTPIGQRADDITTRLDNLGDNIPTTPMAAGPNGPAIPPALADPPGPPHVGDTPTPSPRAPDAPTPHVPDSTPGDRTPVPPHNSIPTATPHAPDAPVDRTPTTHSPTPAGTPAHTPAADQPAGGQHSAPTPLAGSVPSDASTAPAVSGHAPESVPTAAHAPSLAGPAPSPAAPHAPTSTAPEASLPTHFQSHNSGTGGGHTSDSPPLDGGPDVAGRDSSTNGSGRDSGLHDVSDRAQEQSETHSHSGTESPHDGGSVDNGPLTDEKRDEILAMEKGTRPDPSEYLSPEYIEQHLAKFEEGASRFMPQENFDKYGLAQRDGTSFVMATSEIDKLMEATKGDARAMEQALGWPGGYLDRHTVLRIDIPEPQTYNLRIPTGNEAGANDLWLPGGLLPDGLSEAVIDGSDIPPNGYTATNISDD